jgi:hypothetical protein
VKTQTEHEEIGFLKKVYHFYIYSHVCTLFGPHNLAASGQKKNQLSVQNNLMYYKQMTAIDML